MAQKVATHKLSHVHLNAVLMVGDAFALLTVSWVTFLIAAVFREIGYLYDGPIRHCYLFWVSPRKSTVPERPASFIKRWPDLVMTTSNRTV